MTQDRLDLILEECLRQVQTGVPLEDVLKAYPGREGELRPLLETVRLARSLRSENTISLHSQAKSRAALLEAAAQNSQWGLWRGTHTALRSAWALIVAILAVGLIWTGLASAQSLPGDSLYPIKITAERTRLMVVSNPVQRLQLENEYDRERAGELETLIVQHRAIETTFAGFLTRNANESWKVDQVPVVIPDALASTASRAEGEYVDLHGTLMPDGSIIAETIQQKITQFDGKIDAIHADQWLISGISVQVNAETQLDKGLVVGSPVTVEALQRVNQQLLARSIHANGVWQSLLDLVPGNRAGQPTATHETEDRSTSGEGTPGSNGAMPSGSNSETDDDHPVIRKTATPQNPSEDNQPTEWSRPTNKPEDHESHPATLTPTPTGEQDGNPSDPAPTQGSEQEHHYNPTQGETHHQRPTPTPGSENEHHSGPTPTPGPDGENH